MVAHTRSWNDFVRTPGDPQHDSREAMAEVTMRCFGNPNGKEWLGRMAERLFMASQSGGSDFLEGQREVIRQIDKWIAEARANLEKARQAGI